MKRCICSVLHLLAAMTTVSCCGWSVCGLSTRLKAQPKATKLRFLKARLGWLAAQSLLYKIAADYMLWLIAHLSTGQMCGSNPPRPVTSLAF